jgi:hypothetical protein
MKKTIATLVTLLVVGFAEAAVTNLFPNGDFDSPAGVATPWIEASGGGTTTYSYPTTGGNPGGYGRLNNASRLGDMGGSGQSDRRIRASRRWGWLLGATMTSSWT